MLIADKREQSQLYAYCIACNFQFDNNVYYVAETWAKWGILVVHNHHPLVIVIWHPHCPRGSWFCLRDAIVEYVRHNFIFCALHLLDMMQRTKSWQVSAYTHTRARSKKKPLPLHSLHKTGIWAWRRDAPVLILQGDTKNEHICQCLRRKTYNCDVLLQCSWFSPPTLYNQCMKAHAGTASWSSFTGW